MVAFAEGMFWRNVPLVKTGLVITTVSIILRTSVYSAEFIALQTRLYLRRAELEHLLKDQKLLDSLLVNITFIAWTGYCLMLNGVFSGLFGLWLLVSDQINVDSIPKLTIPAKSMVLFSSEHSRQSVFHRGTFLGIFTGLGIVLCLLTSMKGLGVYIVFLSTFHLLEYVSIAINTSQVTLSAFLLNHSKEYNIALVASLMEYLFEWYFIPSFKSWSWITNFAVIICCIGQVIRTSAMLTAKTNFTHIVRISKVEGHELVKTGIYKYFCHPSYTGYFYWAVSLQVILMNPLCFLVYIKTLANFFSNRIVNEEESLIEFFGQDYIDYRKDTMVLIPDL